jgi:hypothetical protein
MGATDPFSQDWFDALEWAGLDEDTGELVGVPTPAMVRRHLLACGWQPNPETRRWEPPRANADPDGGA